MELFSRHNLPKPLIGVIEQPKLLGVGGGGGVGVPAPTVGAGVGVTKVSLNTRHVPLLLTTYI